jgi:uncharacterized pyridoxal phosphate-containing UPF0001 family protein
MKRSLVLGVIVSVGVLSMMASAYQGRGQQKPRVAEIGPLSSAICARGVLPPVPQTPEDARPWFRQVRKLREAWIESGVPRSMLRELSMGMSGDFEVAIQEGATMVRVGTAIFGRRAG